MYSDCSPTHLPLVLCSICHYPSLTRRLSHTDKPIGSLIPILGELSHGGHRWDAAGGVMGGRDRLSPVVAGFMSA